MADALFRVMFWFVRCRVLGLVALLVVMYWRMYWSLGLRQWFIGYLIRRGLYVLKNKVLLL